MKGFPLLNALLVAIALAAGLPFILRLTGKNMESTPVNIAPVTVARAAEVPCEVEFRFAHPISLLQVSHGDKTLFSRADGAEIPLSVTARFPLPLEDGGVDLRLNVVWKEAAGKTALTMILRPDGLEERELTFWAQGAMEEMASFHWKEAAP